MCVLGERTYQCREDQGKWDVCTLSAWGEVADVESGKEQLISSTEGKQHWLQGERERRRLTTVTTCDVHEGPTLL